MKWMIGMIAFFVPFMMYGHEGHGVGTSSPGHYLIYHHLLLLGVLITVIVLIKYFVKKARDA